ncbi:hypothetical protein V5F34_00900 [Xanthobacter autotrophicus]|uniref:hypothetical protein n=1 Tax=Xanthobacter autotrophicus TaxID=280 RepID=UPI003727FCD6
MLAGAGDLAGLAALAGDERGVPAEAGGAELAQGRGNEIEGFTTVGALAGAIVDRLRKERGRMPTIGTTHFFATILAGLARERRDRGEPLIGFVEAEAGYLTESMPNTANAMKEACREARRMRGRSIAAE